MYRHDIDQKLIIEMNNDLIHNLNKQIDDLKKHIDQLNSEIETESIKSKNVTAEIVKVKIKIDEYKNENKIQQSTINQIKSDKIKKINEFIKSNEDKDNEIKNLKCDNKKLMKEKDDLISDKN